MSFLLTFLIFLSVSISTFGQSLNAGSEDKAQSEDRDRLVESLIQEQNWSQAETALTQQYILAKSQSVVTLFNLALTFIKQEKWGWAMACYRQIEWLEPRSSYTKQLKQYLFDQEKLKGLWESSSFIDGLGQELIGFVTKNESIFIFSLVSLMTLIYWVRALGRRKRAIKTGESLPWVGVGVFISTLLWFFVSVLLISVLYQNQKYQFVIVTESAQLRSLPVDGAASLTELRSGQTLVVKQTKKDWFFVQTSKGQNGWAHMSDGEPIGALFLKK